MAVQTSIAAGYLSSFENPIGVSVMSKLAQWPTIQKLGFAGQLGHMNANFHGLEDFKNEIAAYSATNGLLEAAWQVIKQIVPMNPAIIPLLFQSDVLGQVGVEFQQLSGFGQAFAINPTQLKSPASITSQVQSTSTQSAASSAATAAITPTTDVSGDTPSVPPSGSGAGNTDTGWEVFVVQD